MKNEKSILKIYRKRMPAKTVKICGRIEKNIPYKDD